MKHGRLFYIAPMVWVLCLGMLLLSCVTFFFHTVVACIELGVTLVVFIFSVIHLWREQRDIDRYMRRVVRFINEKDEHAVAMSPLPIAAITKECQVLWHNRAFSSQVLGDRSINGMDAQSIMGSVDMKTLEKTSSFEVDIDDRHYLVRTSLVSMRDRDMYIMYYLDVTQLYNDSVEYAATRPIVMLIHIDNLEELMQRLRDSERARIAGQVENALEDWFSRTTGILRKIDDDRFVAVVEKRYLQSMIDTRFDILDRVRTIPIENNLQITLSIGVGEGVNFSQAEKSARQAIEMALGRGGDQAALRTMNGFEFYGGLSKGIEKRTKVRTRVMASALQDLIASSENVLVMGHRFSDLDCIGSGVTLVSVARAMGKPAHLVASRKTTLAEELFVRFEQAGRGDMFLEPSDALPLLKPRTLLIVTDTQNPKLVESEPILAHAEVVAVIDHHRKMIDHIDKAVLFYHESVASSACEMVSELVQYMDVAELGVLEAEALLSGIMLDTRNFVIKAGVRTFEAAAYLRKLGADTVSVKRIFAGSMELHRQKSEIMSDVRFYRHTAIACADGGSGPQLRIACSQAADELLSIKDTDAAFTLFEDAGCVNISARSYGNFNVQLVMEYLGGGGHMTMAGGQLKNISMQQAVAKLQEAIDRYYHENSSKS